MGPLRPNTYLIPKDLHRRWPGSGLSSAHVGQNGKFTHTHLGFAPCQWAHWSAQAAFEPWGLICISNVPCVVHWSMHPAGWPWCTSGEKYATWPKIAVNAYTQGWGNCGTYCTWTGVCPKFGLTSFVSNVSVGCRSDPPRFGNGGVNKWAHDLGLTDFAHKKALMRPAQVEVLAGPTPPSL